uniref:Uncharacterized protein n=1 Tax=Phlebotomus papatasi TaxID=29031 RepID=A0A1B0DR53_PHLPP
MWSEVAKVEKDRFLFDLEFITSDIVPGIGEENPQEFARTFQIFQNQLAEKEVEYISLEESREFCKFVIHHTKIVLKAFLNDYQGNYPTEQDYTSYVRHCEAVVLLRDLLSDAEHQFLFHEANRCTQRQRRRYYVNPLLQDRDQFGFWETFIPDLKKQAVKFKAYTRMSNKQFDFLAKKIRPLIEKNDSFRVPIPPDCRLLITLRHLASGDAFPTLYAEYRVGISTICGIVNEVSEAIWSVFSNQYIVWPINLEVVAEKFASLHNFPHCCGAVDGKHIRIQKPPGSGGTYYNFKGYHSIVLMGICDAVCDFIYVSVGSFGSQSDSSVFAWSDIGTAFYNDDIVWPASKALPNSDTEFNYFLIGDAAYPLSKHFLRPYPGRNLQYDKELFNKRLGTCRNTIERTFGILANRFRILRGEIESHQKNAEKIVKACVTLHNYIKKNCG